MTYSISIERDALKALQKIPQKDRTRIADAIESLTESPRPVGSKNYPAARAGAFGLGMTESFMK